MADFLLTAGINYYLEELIKEASERLILISAYVKLSDPIKRRLSYKNKQKIPIDFIYGKKELQPQELQWLLSHDCIRAAFSEDVHAKCYINEKMCLISSLNLYEFSQVKNQEMGILLRKETDFEAYMKAFTEADEIVKRSVDKKVRAVKKDSSEFSKKLTSSDLAKNLGIRTVPELIEHGITFGLIKKQNTEYSLTQKGEDAGLETRKRDDISYFLWPKDFSFDHNKSISSPVSASSSLGSLLKKLF